MPTKSFSGGETFPRLQTNTCSEQPRTQKPTPYCGLYCHSPKKFICGGLDNLIHGKEVTYLKPQALHTRKASGISGLVAHNKSTQSLSATAETGKAQISSMVIVLYSFRAAPRVPLLE